MTSSSEPFFFPVKSVDPNNLDRINTGDVIKVSLKRSKKEAYGLVVSVTILTYNVVYDILVSSDGKVHRCWHNSKTTLVLVSEMLK